ncbi:MAG: hypothetical protein WD273_13465 [Trueperaceae bacterium]
MSQITLYLNEETAARAREAAASEGVSNSQWVARLLRERLDTTWPVAVRELAGAWGDFPTLEELRKGQATDVPAVAHDR